MQLIKDGIFILTRTFSLCHNVAYIMYLTFDLQRIHIYLSSLLYLRKNYQLLFSKRKKAAAAVAGVVCITEWVTRVDSNWQVYLYYKPLAANGGIVYLQARCVVIIRAWIKRMRNTRYEHLHGEWEWTNEQRKRVHTNARILLCRNWRNLWSNSFAIRTDYYYCKHLQLHAVCLLVSSLCSFYYCCCCCYSPLLVIFLICRRHRHCHCLRCSLCAHTFFPFDRIVITVFLHIRFVPFDS